MTTQKIDAQFLDSLRCPLSKSPVTQQGDFLVASVGGLKYPIKNNIAIMLVDQAILPDGVETFQQLTQIIDQHNQQQA